MRSYLPSTIAINTTKNPKLKQQRAKQRSRQRARARERMVNLGGTHGGFEGGEAVVEGAENGDHVVGDGLALLQRLSY